MFLIRTITEMIIIEKYRLSSLDNSKATPPPPPIPPLDGAKNNNNVEILSEVAMTNEWQRFDSPTTPETSNYEKKNDDQYTYCSSQRRIRIKTFPPKKNVRKLLFLL